MIIQNNNPILAAKELHYLLGWITPSDFTLEEVANVLGIIIKEVPIKGTEGRILINGDSGIISLNSAIDNQGKRNFIIAHEIGHFILHKNLTVFSDTNKTLSEWHKKGQQEIQANEFASELLMPAGLYGSKVTNKKLDIALIREVSSFFNVSLLAAFLRYIELGSFPVMIVYMEKNVVKWKRCSKDFPFQYLPTDSIVPPWTVAGDYFKNKTIESEPEKVDAIEWFPEDFQIKYKPDFKLWEQCYQVAENSLVSCLWTF